MRKHGTKTTPLFLPADGEASWLLFEQAVPIPLLESNALFLGHLMVSS